MRLLKYLKGMAKNVPKTLLISLILIFLSSCTIPATHSRKNIQKSIRDICKDEFNVLVRPRLSGETIWVYAPLEELITEDGQWSEDVQNVWVKILLTLGRVFLSMEDRPKFYCILASSIKEIGFDAYTIGYIPDMVKFNLGFISHEERNRRTVFVSFSNPNAAGDFYGAHMQEYDIPLGEFIASLVAQDLEKKFNSPLLNENFQLNKVSTHYWGNNLKVNFNIKITKPQEGLIDPFDEARMATKEVLDIYNSPGVIDEIEVNNLLTGDVRVYTPENLAPLSKVEF